MRINGLGQPIGDAVQWVPPPRPERAPREGRYCRLEPLDPAQHLAALWESFREDREGRMFTYLAHGPYEREEDFAAWLHAAAAGADPLFFAIVEKEAARGVAAYLRIMPDAGSIEVGHIAYAPRLQRTRAATEAMFLMMQWAFALGYRRYEWKCDLLNQPSRAAAERLGFTFEGIFRQALVYKGRNRDTAWYSVVDAEWPAIAAAYEAWLAPENFDAAGRQLRRLSEFLPPRRDRSPL